jgi:hypothetical protein
MRLEIAVKTSLGFFDRWPREAGDPLVEQAVIAFDARDFVWHSNDEGDGEAPIFPTLTTMVADDTDAVAAETDANRLLSALAYAHHIEMTPMVGVISGFASERSRSIFRQSGGRSALLAQAPARVTVQSDSRLRLTLALNREGLSTESPFFRFLAFWNALEVLFQNSWPDLEAYFVAEGGPVAARNGRGAPAEGWPSYLLKSSRHAVAHAVRPVGRAVLDPDLAVDRRRLSGDALLLDDLVRYRIFDEWPYAVTAN